MCIIHGEIWEVLSKVTHFTSLKSEVLLWSASLLSLQQLAVLAFAEPGDPLPAYREPKWCLVKFKQPHVGWLKSNLHFFWIRRKQKKRCLPLPSTCSLGFWLTVAALSRSNWIRTHTGLRGSIER